MKRNIIVIDEDKCNGCGLCVPACAEGALRIVDGKAKLASEAICDGLGACLGDCPQGAIQIKEQDVDVYDPIAAIQNVSQQGEGAVERHLKHLEDHGQDEYARVSREYLQRKRSKDDVISGHKASGCGCPGSMTRDFRNQPRKEVAALAGPAASELAQWPVQLRLVNPRAPFLQGAELLVSADCVPFACADFHRRFLKGKVLVIFCPKLDEDLEMYVDKLTQIIRSNELRSISMVRMEVPCCGGVVSLTQEAMRRSGKNIILKEYTLSLNGEII